MLGGHSGEVGTAVVGFVTRAFISSSLMVESQSLRVLLCVLERRSLQRAVTRACNGADLLASGDGGRVVITSIGNTWCGSMGQRVEPACMRLQICMLALHLVVCMHQHAHSAVYRQQTRRQAKLCDTARSKPWALT